MTNYEAKEEKALDKIVATLGKLDDTLSELDTLDNDDKKKHAIKKWFEEKKAIHEIKKIAHEAGKYENYDEAELDQAIDYINSLDF
ncbi:hypothetical protein ACYSNW_03455 [Enterococcus sp. LJL99]